MIRIERSESLPDDAVLKANEERDRTVATMVAWFAALAETAAAGQVPPKKPSLSLERYKASEVKDALTMLFAGKCAYCESFYSSTQPMDVEHYRPKGAVQFEAPGDEDHPGYYWLAATWDNLLPSCIDCNRKRGQTEVVVEGTRRRSLGKKDRFPVLGVRVHRHDDRDLADELPALLNPTLDEPTDFLTYDLELGIVVPAQPDGPGRERAEKSIEVYGLNRSGLVQDRLHVIRMIDYRLRLIDQLADIREAIGDQPAVRELVDGLIAQEIALTRELARSDRAYSGLVRQMLADLDDAAGDA